MNTDVSLKTTEIQRFCMHDGPGIRTTVFLKGCPLRCEWCHNPETQKAESQLLFYPAKCIGCKACAQACPASAHIFDEVHRLDREKCISCGSCSEVCPTGALEICGKDLSIEDILTSVEKDNAFYGADGGITLSGGEPLMHRQKAVTLLKTCKERGISTAVETCGYVDPEVLKAAVPYVDLFLWDLKDTNEERHKLYTGVSNAPILKNLMMIDSLGAKIQMRCILVNGVNTEKEHYERISEIARDLNNLEGVKLIPYHAYAGSKNTLLGGNDNGNKDWIPDTHQIEQAAQILTDCGIRVL